MRHRGRDRGWFLYSEGRNVCPLPLYKQGKQGQFAHLAGCHSNFTNLRCSPLLPEAEYIAAGSCCAQLLWMTQTLKDYGIYVRHVSLLCDNESAIKIGHNPVQHSRTKHIEVCHHFIRDHVAKGDINLKHVRTEKQLADIFTKPLDEKVFCRLRGELNIIDASNLE